jgi:hypothetical protein
MLKLTKNKRSEKYLLDLVLKLVSEFDNYFSNGYLNSEGWKVFTIIKRLALKSRPELARRIKSINQYSSYEEVVEVLNSLIENVEFSEEYS